MTGWSWRQLLNGVRPTGEDDRVTTFELFFDLVYVFAATQVTGYMAAIFVVALTIPEAWQDALGGLNGPPVLVGAYLLVRFVHLTLYGVAAAGDRELRHQLAITWGPLLAGAALLIAGALVGGWTQPPAWRAAGTLNAFPYRTSWPGWGSAGIEPSRPAW